MNNKTQKERILDLLLERGEAGAYVYEFMMPRPNGLGIAQYNARIKELREQGHAIENVVPGHFVLKPKAQPTPVKEIIEYFQAKNQLQTTTPLSERIPEGGQIGLF